jgi:serine/threonine-protein kinase HipA
MDIQIYLDGRWEPCAELTLTSREAASRHGGVTLRYDDDYAGKHLYAADYRALSINYPVDFQWRAQNRWPAFLMDLLPQGAARKRLEREGAGQLSDWALLERGARNPVGNLRVHNVAHAPIFDHNGFALNDMLARGDAFIDYAHAVGATVAGATDTQGEAPKFWVVQDNQGRWHPDHGEFGVTALRYDLLKFPVPEAGARNLEMLHAEAAYQRVAQTAGLRVTERLPEFVGDAALLIPRFDRRIEKRREIRLGVESIYSVAKVLDAETHLQHHTVLIELSKHLTDFPAEMLEYIRRDILNIVLGNRDNHGRNTAILKDTDGTMRLAPIYDFGPAFLDARNIVRRIRWDGEDLGGRVDWTRVFTNLRAYFEEARETHQDPPVLVPNVVVSARVIRDFAPTVRQLPAMMHESGVPQSIIDARMEDCQRMVASLEAINV